MNLRDAFLAHEESTNIYDACRRAVSRYFPTYGQLRDIDSLQKAIEGHGVRVYSRDSSFANEGAIEFRPSGLVEISLRRSQSVRRRRFTLAHEIGHWILRNSLFPDATRGCESAYRSVAFRQHTQTEEERLVNLIAAEILLPLDVVERAIPQYQPGGKLRAIRTLCLDRQVSRTTAVRRVADVLGVNVLWIQLVPFRFADLASPAEVDDAMLVSSGEATLYAGESTRLTELVSFRDLCQCSARQFSVMSPKGPVDTVFDVDVTVRPVPHAFAMAFLETGWNN